MIGAIPNPQRSITLNYPVDHVTNVLNELTEVHKVMRIEGYTLQEKNPTILQWKFQKTEFLSLGSIIIVHVVKNWAFIKVDYSMCHVYIFA
jgi:hypothetical protein